MARFRLLAGFLTVTCAACGGGGGSSSGSAAAAVTSATPAPTTSATAAGTPSTAVPSIGSPSLLAARWEDADGSRAVSAGDGVVLTFDRPVRLQAADPALDLTLAPGDEPGAGATLAAGAAPEQVVLRLGASPRLSLFGTYQPGRAAGPGRSPAVVGLRRLDAFPSPTGEPAAAAAPVQVVADDPPVYQGRAYTDPPLAAARAAFGNLHAHTGYSDGLLDPAGAHAHARPFLDFMATTDHLEQLTTAHWDATHRMADAANATGAYVTLVGFEWGHGWIPPLRWYNHINIVGTNHVVALQTTLTPSGLYREALRLGYPDGAIGIFNHPYISKPPLVYDQWDDLAYDGAADKLMVLVDCEGNGSRQTPQLGYLPALARGWHLAPGSNQDNHHANWGDQDDGRTGVWVETLDRASVLRALREGRAFSTGDKNARVRLIANGRLWMGSTVVGAGPVALRVEADDQDGEPFAKLELWSNGQVLSTQTPGAGPVRFDAAFDPPHDAWVFARLYQQDGQELFSAPIYVDR